MGQGWKRCWVWIELLGLIKGYLKACGVVGVVVGGGGPRWRRSQVYDGPRERTRRTRDANPHVAPPWALVHFNTAICILWAGGTVVLGTSDNSTPNMYSNLRQQGGSNHLLPVPMSLLQAWRYQGHAVGADPFSGGLVRIEHRAPLPAPHGPLAACHA